MADPVRTSDVRMRGFGQRTSVAAALAWLDQQLATLPEEHVAVREAAGRVLAANVVSQRALPPFRRAMMDGIALLASDSLNATTEQPRRLQLVGNVLPGRAFPDALISGQAVRIMTGAPLPDAADAVVPVEQLTFLDDRVLLTDVVSAGKHVGQVGEDVAIGATVLPAGRALRPQDLGLLAAIGVIEVAVVRAPRVKIIVTGNELLPAGEAPQGYHIVDANGPMLAALVRRDGGHPVVSGIVPDDRAAISAALMEPVDITLVVGGSSVGLEDHAPQLLKQLGELAIHGIAMRPGGPTGLGRIGDRLVLLLPGNPVACLWAYDLFAGRAIRALGGHAWEWPYRSLRLPLLEPIISQAGRLDCLRVRIHEQGVAPLASAGASALSAASQADGFIVVATEVAGHHAGEEVEIFCY
ncbi:MAG TPA: gephyrin-like molybdotransferase Glp [Pirellulaceae bacterium]|nr:gephyrin-like molybdotransferase Glp [Pirellulaceae bacterium]